MGGTAKLEGKNLDAALKMLHDVCHILDQEGIPYSLDAGTLLGVMRENRLLPWDTDMDLAVSSNNAHKLKNIRRLIHKAGYLTRLRITYKDLGPVKARSYRLMRIYTRRFCFFKKEQLMDIFFKYKQGNLYYWVVDSHNPILQSCEAKHLDMLEQHSFNGDNYSIPKDYDGYLTHHYGAWRTVRKDWNFRLEDGCNCSAEQPFE
ncbi:MAG: LicD family protein [Candidatus Cloacimonetes bacterium]|nr:LicD family protein [Candidatus Cloacimonadota bacterium]